VFAANIARVDELVSDDWKVLDVGGWYRPFNRADVVVDLMDYDSRGLGGSCGAGSEHFSASSWLVHDISGGPMPFADKEFDFVICSHTLEDVRDPVRVCAEMMRVARRGYIEVPSRLIESVRGLEGRNYAGHYHHRWLVEITGNRISFRFKPHAIHEDRRYHLPARFLRDLKPEDRVQWLFWDGGFEAEEIIQISHLQTRRELADFVARHAPLGLRERMALAVRAPLAARRYRTWKAILHPIDTHVRDDSATAAKFWSELPDIASGVDGRAWGHR
jgi:SAM-dependent methyltransferase